jgi:serine/threonine protein kinase
MHLGSFGEVKLAVLTNQKKVAVKTLKQTDSDTREKFLLEARMLAVLKHNHIVQLKGVCTCEQPFWMIIELMEFGAYDLATRV